MLSKERKIYLDISMLQLLYHQRMIAFNLLVCIFTERDNLQKVIQFYYISFMARFLWLLNHEKLPCILQVIFKVIFLKLKGDPMTSVFCQLFESALFMFKVDYSNVLDDRS